jgi:hypothetical protein
MRSGPQVKTMGDSSQAEETIENRATEATGTEEHAVVDEGGSGVANTESSGGPQSDQPSDPSVHKKDNIKNHSETKSSETNSDPASAPTSDQQSSGDSADQSAKDDAKLENNNAHSTADNTDAVSDQPLPTKEESTPTTHSVTETDSGNKDGEETKAAESKPRERKRKSGWDTTSEGAFPICQCFDGPSIEICG